MLKYARRDGIGQWTQEIVYGVGNTGAAPSIGVTSSGHVVIASQHVASRGLHFATNASGRCRAGRSRRDGPPSTATQALKPNPPERGKVVIFGQSP